MGLWGLLSAAAPVPSVQDNVPHIPAGFVAHSQLRFLSWEGYPSWIIPSLPWEGL